MEENQEFSKSKKSVHYLMSNIKEIFNSESDKKVEEVAEDVEKKKDSDLPAVIGMELVSEYVKKESDESDDGEDSDSDSDDTLKRS